MRSHPIISRAVLLLGVLGLLAAGACPAHHDASPAKPPPRASGPASGAAADSASASAQVVLMPPGRDPITVNVEIADDESERTRGLMFREQLAANAGMLFLFERSQQLTFWMRNTYLPLDMIFIEPSMTILGVVENAEPRTDLSRSVPGNSQYVLEVNAGFSREHGLTAGTMVRFVGVGDATAGRRP
jgi:uncharacterized protein